MNLVKLERILTSISTVVSSLYSFCFAAAVTLKLAQNKELEYNTNGPSMSPTFAPTDYYGYAGATDDISGPGARSLLFFYLIMWVGAELVNFTSTTAHRYYANFRIVNAKGGLVEKMFIFKVLSFLTYFFVTVGIGGFLGKFVGKYSSNHFLPKLEYVLELTMTIMWFFIGYGTICVLCIVGLLHQKISDSCIHHPAQGMIFWSWDRCISSCIPTNWCRWLICFPMNVAVFIFTCPISCLMVQWNCLTQSALITFLYATLGLPYFLVKCLMPTHLFDALIKLRTNLYSPSKWANYKPAICVGYCSDEVWWEPHRSGDYTFYIVRMHPAILHGYTRGYTFDTFIVSVIVVLFCFPAGLFFASAIIALVQPFTIQIVGGDLLQGNLFIGGLYIATKCIEVSLQILLPLIRLYAYGKMRQLNALIVQFVEIAAYRQNLDLLELCLDLCEALFERETGMSQKDRDETKRIIEDIKVRLAEERVLLNEQLVLYYQRIVDIAEMLFECEIEKHPEDSNGNNSQKNKSSKEQSEQRQESTTGGEMVSNPMERA